MTVVIVVVTTMTQKDRIRSEEEPFSRGVDAKRRDVLCTVLL